MMLFFWTAAEIGHEISVTGNEAREDPEHIEGIASGQSEVLKLPFNDRAPDLSVGCFDGRSGGDDADTFCHLPHFELQTE